MSGPAIGPERVLPKSVETAAAAPRVAHGALVAAQWAVVALAVVAGLMMLWWPLGHDQAIFALNGATVAHGGLPYRDAFETRGPLAFYVFAALQLVFGPVAWGVRLLDIVIAAAVAVLLGRGLPPFGSRMARRLVGATWILTVVSLRHQDAAQFDLWIGAAVLGGVILLAREAGYRDRDLAIFGLLVGLASLTKPFYPVLLAVPGVVILFRRWPSVTAVARDMAVLIVWWLAPLALTIAWFWAHYDLRDLWEANITYTLNVYPVYAVQHDQRLAATLSFLLRANLIPTAVAAAAAGLVLLWRDRRPLALALATWIVCGLFVVELQGRFFLYQWTVLFPALALLAAAGCEYAVRGSGSGRWLGVAVFASLIAQAALTPLGLVRDWLPFVGGLESEQAYYDGFSVWQTNPADERAVARYVRARTPPGEPIGMWAVDAAVPFLADRPNATRFSERRFLTFAPQHELTRRYRREFVQDIAARKPTYFVVNLYRDPQERPLNQEFPELGRLVAERYARDTTMGALQVLRLKSVR